MRLLARPRQHGLAHGGIGLGEAAFVLAIGKSLPVYRQLLGYKVLAEHDFLPFATPDDVDVELAFQGAGGGLPVVIQLAVVNQRYQHFAAERGEKFALVEPRLQRGAA